MHHEEQRQELAQSIGQLSGQLFGTTSHLPLLTRFYTDSVLLPLEHLTAESLLEGGGARVFQYRYSHRQTVSLADILSYRFWQLMVKVSSDRKGTVVSQYLYNSL